MISQRPSRIQQVYGYAVCLITIVVMLITVTNLVNSAFDLTRPAELGRYGYDENAASFEAYKAQHRNQPADPATGAVREQLSDSTLRVMFNADREAREEYAHWEATKSFVTNGLLLVIAAGIFMMHWRWLRYTGDDSEASGGASR